MSSIIKANEIQNSSGGADVKIQTLKHPSSSSNNLVLASDGSTTISNATLTNASFGSALLEYHRYTSLLNNFVAWDLSDPPSDESGVIVQRFGPLYIVQTNMYVSTGSSTGHATWHFLTLDSNITNPSNTVKMGTQQMGNTGDNDFVTQMIIESDGKMKIYVNNSSGTTMHITGNFIGLDTA